MPFEFIITLVQNVRMYYESLVGGAVWLDDVLVANAAVASAPLDLHVAAVAPASAPAVLH